MRDRSARIALGWALLLAASTAGSAGEAVSLRFVAGGGGQVAARTVHSSRGFETEVRVSALSGGELALVYAVEGVAAARVAEDGRSVAFPPGSGHGALRLGELTARDAFGRDLPARWSIDSAGPARIGLRLLLDASGARTPVVVAAALQPVAVSRPKQRPAADRSPLAPTASPPSNDACPGAEIVPGTGPFPWSSAIYDVSGASSSGDPPAPSCQPSVSRSVWFRFTAAATTEYSFSLCPETPTATTLEDTVLALYASPDGECGGGLEEIAGGCDDDSCDGFQSSIWNIRLLAGRTYYIVAYAYGTAPLPPGGADVQLRVMQAPPVAPPPNDRCDAAETIPGGGPFPAYSAVVDDVTGATSEGDPAPPACQANVSRSVWYRFSPAAPGRYEIATCADGPAATTVDDTVLALYRSDSGSCAGLVPLAGGCDDDGCVREARQSALESIELEAGATYFVLVHAFGASRPAPGSTAVQLRIAPAPEPPANDSCTGAEVIPSSAHLPYLTAVTENRAATATGDPAPACRPGASRGLWYGFRPPATDLYQLALCAAAPTGTTLANTVLSVYASADGGCDALVPVDGGCDDDGCLERPDQSFIGSLELKGGTTYFVVAQQVGDTRYGPADARVQLRLDRTAPGADADRDGVPDAVDCAPTDAATWNAPGPARELGFDGDRERLSWLEPTAPGASALRYDLLRSDAPDGFGALDCLEQNTLETESVDAGIPRPLFAYLVRSRNACGSSAGTDAAGRTRTTGACP